LLFDLKVKLSEEHKLRLIRGIAAGMLHLHKHNIIHRDLAARNIALTATGEPKITVFVFLLSLLLFHSFHSFLNESLLFLRNLHFIGLTLGFRNVSSS
jgi:serine/threonine protein kinase